MNNIAILTLVTYDGYEIICNNSHIFSYENEKTLKNDIGRFIKKNINCFDNYLEYLNEAYWYITANLYNGDFPYLAKLIEYEIDETNDFDGEFDIDILKKCIKKSPDKDVYNFICNEYYNTAEELPWRKYDHYVTYKCEVTRYNSTNIIKLVDKKTLYLSWKNRNVGEKQRILLPKLVWDLIKEYYYMNLNIAILTLITSSEFDEMTFTHSHVFTFTNIKSVANDIGKYIKEHINEFEKYLESIENSVRCIIYENLELLRKNMPELMNLLSHETDNFDEYFDLAILKKCIIIAPNEDVFYFMYQTYHNKPEPKKRWYYEYDDDNNNDVDWDRYHISHQCEVDLFSAKDIIQLQNY